MSTDPTPTCPACGARLDADATACDLCGTPVDATDLPQVDAPDAASRSPAEAAPPADRPADAASPVYCNACGWKNPSGARYCSQCGDALQTVESPERGGARSKPVDAELPRAESAPATDDTADEAAAETDDASSTSVLLTRQIGLVVGVAILAVIGLFVVSSLSQQADWGGSEEDAASPGAIDGSGPAGGGAAPLAASGGNPSSLMGLVRQNATDSIPAPLREQIATLQEEIEQRSGVERRAKQQELVNLYVGAGQLAQAAVIQRRIAESAGTPEAWRRAGDLLYSWMEMLQGQQPASSQVAEYVVAAYQKVLDQQPDNLDVRTDMATAYLQTNQPMRGVDEINRVLEENPDHFQARFNKGIMLTMIGRAEEAIAQFERVKEIVGTDSPYYQQAEQAIQTIRSRMEQESAPS